MKGLIMEIQCSVLAVKNYYRMYKGNRGAKDIDSLGSNFVNLSLTEKKRKDMNETNNIPPHLIPFIEACEIKLI